MIGAALRSVAQKGAELARQLADDATSGLGQIAAASALPLGQLSGFKFQRQYRLGNQTGTVGPHGLWRVYAGFARGDTAINRDVSIWVLDKKELASKGDGGSLQGSSHGTSATSALQHRWEPVLEQQRHGCTLMTRLKHPGVVRVVMPLEENAAHMVLVTEPVRGSLREVLAQGHQGPGSGGVDNGGHAGQANDFAGPGSGRPPGQEGGEEGAAQTGAAPGLSMLEVKLGLLELAEVLTFLHGTARLAHCGLTPQTVVVAADGGWKLAGFSFATPASASEGGPGVGGSQQPASCRPPFEYGDPFPPLWEELAKPQLPYTAPELVVPPGGSLSAPFGSHISPGNPFLTAPAGAWEAAPASWAPADAFSLGAIAYELVAAVEGGGGSGGGGGGGGGGGQPLQLLPVRCSIQQYGTKVAALGQLAAGSGAGAGGAAALSGALSRVPPGFQGLLLSLVAPVPATRPAPAALSRCAWFEGDTLLGALRFLEGMVQSDLRDKLAFLADFAGEDGTTTSASGIRHGGVGAAGEALWRRIPDRLLAGRVLPPLLQEVRTGGPGAVAALPVSLAVSRRLGRAAFASITLPVLSQVIESAASAVSTGATAGDGTAMLAALVAQSEAMAGLMDGPTLDRVLLPLLLRAVLGPGAGPGSPTASATGEGSGAPGTQPAPVPTVAADPRLAQAALARLQALVASGLLDSRSQQVRSRLLPTLRAAATRTTSAGVRMGCLGLMASLAGRVDRTEGEAILTTCTQLLSVDTSGGTLLAVGALAEALAEAPGWGPVAAAQRLLPMLVPHLVAPSLTVQQLAALGRSVQNLMSAVMRHAEEAAQLRAAAAGGPLANAGILSAASTGSSAAPGSNSAAAGSGKGKAASSGLVAFTTWAGAGATNKVAASNGASTGPGPGAGNASGPGASTTLSATSAASGQPRSPAGDASTSYSNPFTAGGIASSSSSNSSALFGGVGPGGGGSAGSAKPTVPLVPTIAPPPSASSLAPYAAATSSHASHSGTSGPHPVSWASASTATHGPPMAAAAAAAAAATAGSSSGARNGGPAQQGQLRPAVATSGAASGAITGIGGPVDPFVNFPPLVPERPACTAGTATNTAAAAAAAHGSSASHASGASSYSVAGPSAGMDSGLGWSAAGTVGVGAHMGPPMRANHGVSAGAGAGACTDAGAGAGPGGVRAGGVDVSTWGTSGSGMTGTLAPSFSSAAPQPSAAPASASSGAAAAWAPPPLGTSTSVPMSAGWSAAPFGGGTVAETAAAASAGQLQSQKIGLQRALAPPPAPSAPLAAAGKPMGTGTGTGTGSQAAGKGGPVNLMDL